MCAVRMWGVFRKLSKDMDRERLDGACVEGEFKGEVLMRVGEGTPRAHRLPPRPAQHPD